MATLGFNNAPPTYQGTTGPTRRLVPQAGGGYGSVPWNAPQQTSGDGFGTTGPTRRLVPQAGGGYGSVPWNAPQQGGGGLGSSGGGGLSYGNDNVSVPAGSGNYGFGGSNAGGGFGNTGYNASGSQPNWGAQIQPMINNMQRMMPQQGGGFGNTGYTDDINELMARQQMMSAGGFNNGGGNTMPATVMNDYFRRMQPTPPGGAPPLQLPAQPPRPQRYTPVNYGLTMPQNPTNYTGAGRPTSGGGAGGGYQQLRPAVRY